MTKLIETRKHPVGGTFQLYELNNGNHAVIIGPDYPGHDDYEIHLYAGDFEVIAGTEQRAADRDAADAVLETLGAQ